MSFYFYEERLKDGLCPYHDRPVKISLEDSVDVTRVLLAVMESAGKRQPVEVEPCDINNF